jgi:hypothetical protein
METLTAEQRSTFAKKAAAKSAEVRSGEGEEKGSGKPTVPKGE